MPKVIGDPGSGKRLFKVTLDGVKGYAHAVDETDAIKAVRDVGGISYCVHQSAVAVDDIDPEDAVEADVVAVNDELTAQKVDDETKANAIRKELKAHPGITNAEVVKNLKAKDVKVTSAQVTKVRNAESV